MKFTEEEIKETIAQTKITDMMKDVFTMHGAVDVDTPILSPALESFTVFVSMR